MSIAATDAVWAMAGLDPYEKLVLLALADRQNINEDVSYPSVADLVTRTGMGERGVQKVVRRLAEKGVLTVMEGGGRHQRNRYKINENPAPGAPIGEKPRTGNGVSGSDTPHPVHPLGPEADENPAPGSENPAPGAPEPEENQEKKEEASDEASSPTRLDLTAAVAAFNDAAARTGWPRVLKFTDRRRKAMSARFRDAGGTEGWLAALATAEASKFLTGRDGTAQGPPPWFDFDWLLKPDNFVKLMEGKYGNRPSVIPFNGGPNGREAQLATRRDAEAERLRRVVIAAASGSTRGGGA